MAAPIASLSASRCRAELDDVFVGHGWFSETRLCLVGHGTGSKDQGSGCVSLSYSESAVTRQ